MVLRPIHQRRAQACEVFGPGRGAIEAEESTDCLHGFPSNLLPDARGAREDAQRLYGTVVAFQPSCTNGVRHVHATHS